MRLLLDTQAFLWWVFDDARLSKKAKKLISDSGNECFVSAASAWELAIKAGLGKIQLNQAVSDFFPQQLRENNFQLLDLKLQHITAVEALPSHHRDPFDRLLVVQAITERLVLVSGDKILAKYKIERVW